MRTILIVTENFPNLGNSFLGTYVVEQLRELKKYYRIVVLVPTFISLRNQIWMKQPHHEHMDGFEVYRIKHHPFYIRWLVYLHLLPKSTGFLFDKKIVHKKLMRLATKLHQTYHFSLVHGHEVFVGDEASPIGKALGIPSVITIHGLATYHMSVVGKAVFPSILQNLRSAGDLITVSQMAKSSYTDLGLHHPRFQVIYNGISFPEPGELRVPWKSKIIGKRVVLSVGFFTEQKRMPHLVEVASRLRKQGETDFCFLLIGKGLEVQRVQNLINRHHLEDIVFLCGEVPPKDVTAFFEACDVFVLPSVSESFSIACLEAMAQAKPVICTKNAGITELLHDGEDSFIVPADDLEALTRKVKVLLDNGHLRQQLGEASFRIAKSLTWENQAKKIRAVYDSLIA